MNIAKPIFVGILATAVPCIGQTIPPVVARALAAAAADLSRPSRVTLHLKDAPAREAYEATFAQASVPLTTLPPNLFDVGPHANQRVTINVNGVTFWQAMSALSEQTGLMMKPFGRELYLTHDPFRRQHLRSFQGPFMVQAEVVRDGRLGSISVFVEPRLQVLAYRREAEIERAISAVKMLQDRARRRHPAQQQPGQLLGSEGGDANVFEVTVDGFPEGVSYVKGRVRLRAVTRKEKVEIVDFAAAAAPGLNVNGRQFIVHLTDVGRREYDIWIKAINSVPPAPAFHILDETVVDAAGNRLLPVGGERVGTPMRVDCLMTVRQFPNVGPPAKLILTFPTKVEEFEIPFEFGKVPADDAG